MMGRPHPSHICALNHVLESSLGKTSPLMEGGGILEARWGAARRLRQDITDEDKRRATVQ